MRRILPIFIALYLTGCFFGKNFKHSNSVKLPYVDFFIDVGVTQYFIKPLKFISDDKKMSLTIDFTFRDTLRDNSPTIVNYSIFSKKLIPSIDSIYILINNEKIFLSGCKKLFLKRNKIYELRYSCQLPYKKTLSFFYYKPIICIFIKEKKLEFYPVRMTLKKMEFIKKDVIQLIYQKQL